MQLGGGTCNLVVSKFTQKLTKSRGHIEFLTKTEIAPLVKTTQP